jgi:hypothetical protein
MTAIFVLVIVDTILLFALANIIIFIHDRQQEPFWLLQYVRDLVRKIKK